MKQAVYIDPHGPDAPQPQGVRKQFALRLIKTSWAEEVGPLSKQQLKSAPLAKLRSDIVRKPVRRSGALPNMLDYKRRR
jgi:hypothetical protein